MINEDLPDFSVLRSGMIVVSKSSVSASLTEGVVSNNLLSRSISGLGLTVISGSTILGSAISSWNGTTVVSSDSGVCAGIFSPIKSVEFYHNNFKYL